MPIQQDAHLRRLRVNRAFGVRTRAQKKRDDLIRETDRDQTVPGLQVVKEEVGESVEGVSNMDSKRSVKQTLSTGEDGGTTEINSSTLPTSGEENRLCRESSTEETDVPRTASDVDTLHNVGGRSSTVNRRFKLKVVKT